MEELILVSNWEEVDKDDFYLSKDWEKQEPEQIIIARELQKENNLFVAYIVKATNYAIYKQMDASQVFINEDSDVILNCENEIINSDYEHRIEYKY